MPKKIQAGKRQNTEKKREKAIVDKTFGMKNKGGKKAQKITQSFRNAQQSTKQFKQEQAQRAALKKSKELAKKEQEEMNQLFRSVAITSESKEKVDPSNTICEFFKVNACKKGKKCKFLHDQNKVRRADKIDIYTDPRDNTSNSPSNTTICKFFLEAVENMKYGYFQNCPNNGEKCQYSHCLPEGYVLERDKPKLKEQEESDYISLEETLEKMRAELSGKTDLTPITIESFQTQKANKKVRVEKDRKENAKKELASNSKLGKAQNSTSTTSASGLSGRDLFAYDPSLFVDDEAAQTEKFVIQSDNDSDTEDNVVGLKVDNKKNGISQNNGEQIPIGNEDLFLDVDIDDNELDIEDT